MNMFDLISALLECVRMILKRLDCFLHIRY